MMVNVDHGAIPAATKVIKADLNLDNTQLGSLGSLVFVGIVFGSLFATIVFNNLPYKVVITFCFLGNAIGLIIFAQSHTYPIQCFARFFSGFNQILLCIYLPLYVDTFCANTSKSYWMSAMLIGAPLGVIIGYLMTAVMQTYYSWQLSFWIQGIMSLFFFVMLLFVPSRYLEIKKM